MAKRRDYGFVRSYASLGRDVDDLQKLIAAGYGGALFDYNDPYLAQAIADARGAGIPFGIWGDPNAVNNNARAFALRMAQLNSQYNPDLIVPDIEFVGKGYQGSPGWAFNEELARYWQQYLPGVRTAVTVMPNQNDFNYEAWNPLGAEWLPQAYGADPNTQVYDPRQIVQTLINRGVDPSMISPVLGPGHSAGYGGAGLWTVDDFIGRDIPKAYGLEPPSPVTGGQGARTTSSTKPAPGRSKSPLQYLGQGFSQAPERIQNQGLQWFGKTFGNQQAFAQELQRRGRSYAEWAAQHQPAAQALQGRK